MMLHDEYIQSKQSQMTSASCSSLHKEKPFTVDVLVGLSVPPCQHDGSLLHTERWWWLEFGAAAEG